MNIFKNKHLNKLKDMVSFLCNDSTLEIVFTKRKKRDKTKVRYFRISVYANFVCCTVCLYNRKDLKKSDKKANV